MTICYSHFQLPLFLHFRCAPRDGRKIILLTFRFGRSTRHFSQNCCCSMHSPIVFRPFRDCEWIPANHLQPFDLLIHLPQYTHFISYSPSELPKLNSFSTSETCITNYCDCWMFMINLGFRRWKCSRFCFERIDKLNSNWFHFPLYDTVCCALFSGWY